MPYIEIPDTIPKAIDSLSKAGLGGLFVYLFQYYRKKQKVKVKKDSKLIKWFNHIDITHNIKSSDTLLWTREEVKNLYFSFATHKFPISNKKLNKRFEALKKELESLYEPENFATTSRGTTVIINSGRLFSFLSNFNSFKNDYQDYLDEKEIMLS